MGRGSTTLRIIYAHSLKCRILFLIAARDFHCSRRVTGNRKMVAIYQWDCGAVSSLSVVYYDSQLYSNRLCVESLTRRLV